MAKLVLRQTQKQSQFELEIDIPEEINGDDEKVITGNMTFLPKKTRGDGSFSIKITSSMLSRVTKERKAVLKAAFEAIEQGYDNLLNMKEEYEEGILSANGQTHLQAELDASTAPSEGLAVGFEE